MTEWVPVVAGVGSAVAGGFYLAFSGVVVPALRRRPPAESATTMAAINEEAERAPFLLVFFGTTVAAFGTIVMSVADPEPAAPFRIVGASLYLVGVVSTIAANVPINRRLASAGDLRAEVWSRFALRWTRLNHLRMLLSIAAALVLLVPLARR
ncbi:DUF1772 domain-containing protein [Mycetocola zhadangensis]|uniref:DUF1772 domain-containing protein n=1 Tax=Mycetocola zhadangensis TaxID=1164595 RepID=A0A3L7J1S0_9MICO|nr:anthrone oxygenase family protein [Mycetocola zhadangensis]RLQ84195.1 DUF1772 domain-containing protein [Mycetocola zhadangensis]GGE95275.1 membrane protein [Mycetocola zhadangensis]